MDYLDVQAPNAQRQALLQRVLSQSSANNGAARSFDALNREGARNVNLPSPPGMAHAATMNPSPSAGPGKTPVYPGTPITGTASFLQMPPALQQLFLKTVTAPLTPGATDDTTRAVLAGQNGQGA